MDSEQVVPAAEDCIMTLRSSRADKRIREINREMTALTGEERKRALEEIMQLRKAQSGRQHTRTEGKDVS